MWCKTCNIETNEELCPVCGSVTIEDIPTEIYWCTHCEVPIIQVTTQADKGFCPLCAKKMKYLSADLRPVFPEERLLLELLLGEEPFAYIESLYGQQTAGITSTGNPFQYQAKPSKMLILMLYPKSLSSIETRTLTSILISILLDLSAQIN